MTRIAAVGCSSIAVALQLVTWTPAATAPDLTVRFRGPFGSGADAAWLLEPSTRPTSVVVFLHGWKLAPPSPSYPWVGQFRPWLDHLVSGGSVVLFAAYQRGGDAQGPVRVESLRHGLEQGFGHLPRLLGFPSSSPDTPTVPASPSTTRRWPAAGTCPLWAPSTASSRPGRYRARRFLP